MLCFALGALAWRLRSDLRLPEGIPAALSIYLMLSIGLKGGVELGAVHFADIAAPLAAALALGCAIPLWCYALLRRLGGLGIPDAAALAAHYGSVSAVTFAAATAMLDRQGTFFEGHAVALLAVMEVPAVVISIALARLAMQAAPAGAAGGAILLGGSAGAGWGGAGPVLRQVLSSKSVVLLVGGLVIGALAGKSGTAAAMPFFAGLFPGVLCLFLLDLGRAAAERAGEFRRVGLFLAGFGIAMPLLHAVLGIGLGTMAGLSEGGALLLGTLAASASYIVAPAAVRVALPEANPGLYLTCSLAITFPFNMLVGLPLYAAIARQFAG